MYTKHEQQRKKKRDSYDYYIRSIAINKHWVSWNANRILQTSGWSKHSRIFRSWIILDTAFMFIHFSFFMTFNAYNFWRRCTLNTYFFLFVCLVLWRVEYKGWFIHTLPNAPWPIGFRILNCDKFTANKGIISF